MNPQDYDSDGNNIVPCPICLSAYCASKEGGTCPDEAQFVADMNKKALNDHIINNILPKDADTDFDDGYYDILNRGYNSALADCRAKLPEILDYVYAELRKKVEESNKWATDVTSNDSPLWDAHYAGYREAIWNVLSLLSTNQK